MPSTRYRPVPETKPANQALCTGDSRRALGREMRVSLQRSHCVAIPKDNTYFIEWFQSWCATDESDELWCVEYDFIEESYVQVDESRGIDVGHKVVRYSPTP